MSDKKNVAPPPQPLKLSRDRIVKAAIAIIEQQGLAALSARKLASVLGCEAMSLYRHINNMDDLLDHIVDELVGSVSTESKSMNAVSKLKRDSLSYLNLARSHPNSFQLIVTRKWRTERAMAASQGASNVFVALGFDPRSALSRARTLGAYLNGSGLALASWYREDKIAKTSNAKEVHTDLKTGLAILFTALIQSTK